MDVHDIAVLLGLAIGLALILAERGPDVGR